MRFETADTSFRISFSFIAFVVLMMLLCDEKIVFISLCSSVFHETGHMLFIYFVGDKPKAVELTLFGMRIDRTDHSIFSYKKEALIAAGGIIFNLIFALCCYIIFLTTKNKILFILAVVNIVIASINSVPVRILDAGRIIRCLLLSRFDNEKSETIVDYISYISVILLSAVTLIYCIFVNINFSLIAVTIYILSITLIKKWS